ncbi:hypothetical protein [Pseudomonas sp. LB3P38]|uniref:hypothetical protein n=1 Tax=Pseudomonas lyxosi TaxID=3398358 RepID=UPI0039EE32C0
MANINATEGVLVDGQLTVETKDITNATSPVTMTTFTTTAMEYSYDISKPAFLIICYKDKGLSSERGLTISFLTGEEPRIRRYSEAFTKETGKSLYDFEIIDYTGNIETMEITPDKRRYNVIDFKILAKRRDNNETRELTGRGHIFITNQTMAL